MKAVVLLICTLASPALADHPSVCRVAVPAGRGVTDLGSGSVVAVSEDGTRGLVVTNWHVVNESSGKGITVAFPGRTHGARLIASDRTWDLATLEIANPPAALVVAVSAPLGEQYTIHGYGGGDYRAASGRGVEMCRPMNRPEKDTLVVRIAARNGDSGGPILNRRGELAGVLWGSVDGDTYGSYAPRIRKFLASVKWASVRSVPGKSLREGDGEIAWLNGRWWSAQIDEDGCWRFWSDGRWVLRSELPAAGRTLACQCIACDCDPCVCSAAAPAQTRIVTVQDCSSGVCQAVPATARLHGGVWWVKVAGKWQYWRGGKWTPLAKDAPQQTARRAVLNGVTFRRVYGQNCGSYG